MNRSIQIAAGLLLAVSLYMLTGLSGCQDPEAELDTGANLVADPVEDSETPVMKVQVREMTATDIPREIILTGKTVPSRSVELKAETAGRIAFVAEKRGQPVADGEELVKLDPEDRPDRLEQARATLEATQLEYEAALRLQKQGMRSSSQVAEALARVRGAGQMVRMLELDLGKTSLMAPFEGILQERFVELGDYVGIADPVARIIDLDPLILEGQVTEFQIEHMRIGEKGVARLADGLSVEGHIRYVAGEADPQTRTFKVELEVPNPDLAIPAGITAKIAVETERVTAHRISPALISIADDGRFGVKVVDGDNVVRFIEADIVKTEPEAIWLAGMPEQIRLITVGQGFTHAGDRVDPVPETSVR